MPVNKKQKETLEYVEQLKKRSLQNVKEAITKIQSQVSKLKKVERNLNNNLTLVSNIYNTLTEDQNLTIGSMVKSGVALKDAIKKITGH